MTTPIEIKENGDVWLLGKKIELHNQERLNLALELHKLEITKVVPTAKTLHNSTASGARQNVKDIKFWGDGDTFKLISKASSQAEGWMKSTKAMEIPNLGCVVQVSTQQDDNVAEAVCFVPGVCIIEKKTTVGEVVERRLHDIRTLIPTDSEWTYAK